MSRSFILILLLVLVAITRFVPYAGEFYATWVYPYLSYGLSFIASFCPFSLEEWIVMAACACLILFPIISLFLLRNPVKIMRGELEIIGWLVVWFYLGWGCNYFRNNLYQRLMLEPVATDSLKFVAFVQEYTDSLNGSYVATTSMNRSAVLAEIKNIYTTVPPGYGLAQPQSFQRPKQVFFNQLYSGVGVLGYMGPFMAESQLNQQLPHRQYPFILAHETAHLLGVSSEAEANFWAYCVCLHSDLPEVRYSGYYSLLPYVVYNTRSILGESAAQDLLNSVNPVILDELRQQQDFWQSVENPTISKIQDKMYDLFLKSNQISTGTQNYSEVIGMLMAIRESHEEPLRRQTRRLSKRQ